MSSKRHFKVIIAFFVGIFIISTFACEASKTIKLPPPDKKGNMSVEEAIQNRRSIRNYKNQSVSLKEVSQILWAAGGITVDGVTGPTRAYASAGGTYPLDIYIVAGNVDDLSSGIYKYDPAENSLLLITKGDLRGKLAAACRGQRMVKEASFSIVVVADYSKNRYGKRGENVYVPMDAGHLGQNVHLQAESLGLGTVMVGAFVAKNVTDLMGKVKGTPVYVIPVGKK